MSTNEEVQIWRLPPALVVTGGADGLLHVGAGGQLVIDAGVFGFAFAVVDDLGGVADTGEGSVLLAACETLHHRIRIVRPEVKSDPPNASVEPADRIAATAKGVPTGQRAADGSVAAGTGTGSGSAIFYDPDDWPWPGDPNSPDRPSVLMALLRQALRNATGADAPTDGRTCCERTG